jgi:hypothetical protein
MSLNRADDHHDDEGMLVFPSAQMRPTAVAERSIRNSLTSSTTDKLAGISIPDMRALSE